jgi:hypothetical protein
MTHEKMESEYPLLVENSSRFELSYEVYPARIGEADEGPEQWFEIALYLELKECRPEPREGSLLLIGLADHLLQRVRSHAPFDLEMPPAYYSWHPASGDEDREETRPPHTVESGTESFGHPSRQDFRISGPRLISNVLG